MNYSVETAKDWLRQAFVYDFAEKQYLARVGMAKGNGLDPNLYCRPFPGSPIIVPIAAPPAPQDAAKPAPPAKAPVWMKIAAAGLLATAAAGAGAGGTYLATRPDTAPPARSGVGYQVQQWNEAKQVWESVGDIKIP